MSGRGSRRPGPERVWGGYLVSSLVAPAPPGWDPWLEVAQLLVPGGLRGLPGGGLGGFGSMGAGILLVGLWGVVVWWVLLCGLWVL